MRDETGGKASNLDLEKMFPNVKLEIKDILTDVLSGRTIGIEEVYMLFNANSEAIPALMAAANYLRLKGKGRITSYSKKVFIPLTNLCRNACGYCGFRRNPQDKDAGYLNPREVLEIAEKGKRSGCHEALFTLGEKPEEKYPEAKRELRRLGYANTVEYLRNMCEVVAKETGLLPHSNPGVITKQETAELREVNASLGLMLENISSRLCLKNGPHEFSPGKNPDLRLAMIENAGQLHMAFTTGLLIGIGETLEERIDSLFALRRLHDRYGHIQEIIIQPFKSKPKTPMQQWAEPTASDILRTVAVARLILGESVNIQVPPNLARNMLQVLSLAGINDWGGISPVTVDHINPSEPWLKIDELKLVTFECGFSLKERLPLYPEYITEKQEFIPENLKKTILETVDDMGYVKG